MGGGRRRSLVSALLLVIVALASRSPAEASSPTASVVKRLSSLIQWSRVSPKVPQTDGGNVLQFESGYLVETLVEGNKLGVEPHTIRISPEGELFAVDSVNSNIVRITPPLSQYSRARLVAGSFQGYSGHVDGKPSDARFHSPKGVTMDGKGNVYVADTANFAIRKISETGVTTIAGGKSNIAGYRDGPSEDAKFSNDFDVAYVQSTCSLLVIDRGNAAIRQILLLQDDCNHQDTSISTTDIFMVLGAVLIGYASCLLQQGIGSSIFQKRDDSCEIQNHSGKTNTSHPVDPLKEDTDAGWPSFATLVADLSKWGFEVFGKTLLSFVPEGLFFWKAKKDLSPLKDHLVMPEDTVDSVSMQKHKMSPPIVEAPYAPDPSSKLTILPTKSSKIPKLPLKDPSLSTKHRSSKRQEYTDFYGSGENQGSSKILKERTRHRTRDKAGEVAYGLTGQVQSGESKPSYMDGKFEQFNTRTKFGMDGAFNM